MTDLKLTPKQEAFCQAYIETGNASEAYRKAYDCSKTTDRVIWVKACELLKSGKVSVRVRELAAKVQKMQEEKFEITMETITRMLLEDRTLARELGQSSAAVTASKTLAQIHGLVIDRKEVGKPGEFADLEDMSDSDLADIARGGSGRASTPSNGPTGSAQLH
jgi:phage terminase small subunit